MKISYFLTSNVEIGRILRYLASVQIIKETGVDMYAASHISNTLATQGLIDGVNHKCVIIPFSPSNIPVDIIY